MTDKQINRWLRRKFSGVGWLLILYYGLMTLLTSLMSAVDMAKQALWAFAAGDYTGSVDWNAINSNAWGYIAAMLTGFVVLDAWKGKDYRKQELFRKENPMKGRTFFCFLIFCMGAQMINTLWISLLELLMNANGGSVVAILEQVAGSSDTFSMFFYASILAPVWEELLFRGVILRKLQLFGKRFAVLCSAVLFGLFHGNLLQTPYAILIGLVLGYVTVEYSIIWAMALHMFNNLVLADLLTRLTASCSEMAYGTLHYILFGGSALISVVILVRHRQQIRSYRNTEWMDRRCLECFFTNFGILVFTACMCISMAMMFFV
jgi:membrane protease YdiL (CAAX protease family)